MRSIYLSIIAALLTGCAREPESRAAASTPQIVAADPIDQLVTRLSATHGLWHNGRCMPINLPETAAPEQVLEQIFKISSFDKGRVTTYKILAIREVHIDGGLYTAAFVQTDLGKKIALFTAGGFWNRVYDP